MGSESVVLPGITILFFYSFSDHLEAMFGEGMPPAPWDTEHKYQLHDLRIFFEDKEKGKLYSVDHSNTLSQVLSDPRYIGITVVVQMSILFLQLLYQHSYDTVVPP